MLSQTKKISALDLAMDTLERASYRIGDSEGKSWGMWDIVELYNCFNVAVFKKCVYKKVTRIVYDLTRLLKVTDTQNEEDIAYLKEFKAIWNKSEAGKIHGMIK